MQVYKLETWSDAPSAAGVHRLGVRSTPVRVVIKDRDPRVRHPLVLCQHCA